MATIDLDDHLALLLADAPVPGPPSSEPAEADKATPQGRAAHLLALVRSGDYTHVMRDPLALELLVSSDAVSAGAADRARRWLSASEMPTAAASSIIAIGASALCLFAHINWMGGVAAHVASACGLLADARCEDALLALQADGEVAYSHLEAPRLLCAARALLVDVIDATEAALPGPAAPWWAARCAVLHQRCLDATAPSLERAASGGMRRALERLGRAAAVDQGDQQGADVSQEGGEGDDGAAGLSGQRVQVHGLEGRPELNGQRGVVGAYDGAKGRYAVKLDGGGDGILLKAANLAPVLPAAGAADGPSDADDAHGDGAATTLPGCSPHASRLVRDATALAHLELAQSLLQHQKTSTAALELEAAKAALGVCFELTGALGRRTKHQESATSLLVLRVLRLAHTPPRGDLETAAEAAAAAEEAAEAGVPQRIVEEDDQLLNTPKYEDGTAEGSAAASGASAADAAATATADAADADATDGGGSSGALPHAALRPLEQCAVLAECVWVQRSRPMHESTSEEMEPYVRAAIALPRCWACVSHALRTKAHLEASHKRRRHQSLMQLSALMDDVRPTPEDGALLMRHLGPAADADAPAAAAAAAGTADSAADSLAAVSIADGAASPHPPATAATAAEDAASSRRLAGRMRCFWAAGLAPRWVLGSELARTLAALGLLGEASKLFEELGLWDECITAIAAMGHVQQAEEMVRSRLAAAPSASMWCHLGDLTGDIAHFETAWDLSAGSCARAKLKLGSASMRAERWAEAREHLKAALRVRAHYAEAWYCSAVCSLKLEESEAAMSEMRKVVSIDPTHYQAWSSLGGLFAKQGKMKREALYAFREACKFRGDSWQLWQHTALAALALGRIEETIQAEGMSLKCGGPPAPQVSSLVAQAVAKDVRDGSDDGRTTRRLLPKARQLLKTSCETKPTDAAHWEARLHLEKKYGTSGEVSACLRAQLAAYQAHAPWRTDTPTLSAVSEVAAQLVEVMLEGGALKEAREARALVEGLLHEASEHLAASPGCEELRMLLSRIQRHLDDD